MKFRFNYLAILFLFLLSCEKDSSEAAFDEQSTEELKGISLTAMDYMLVAVVQGSYCPTSSSTNDEPGGYSYTIYASSGLKTFPVDMQVYAYIVDTDKNGEKTIVDAAILQLKANTTKTNNVPIFQYATKEYGKVEVKIAEIERDGVYVTDQFQLRNTTPSVNNCYQKPIAGATNCLAENGSSTPGTFEPAGDSDNDGICDNKDKDDDNDLIPDIVDEDDDGDGIPDDEENNGGSSSGGGSGGGSDPGPIGPGPGITEGN